MHDVTLLADAHVDTSTGDLVPGPTVVVVRDGVVAEVRSGDAAAPPAEARRLAAGTVLAPAFVDPHVHLAFLPRDDHGETTDATLALSEDERRDLVLAHAAELVTGGVVATRDCGDVDYAVAAIDPAAWPCGLRVATSGPPVTTPTGHLHWCTAESAEALTPDALVDNRARAGASWVKVMASGGQMTASSDPLAQQFDRTLMGALVDEAGRRGLRTASHALNLAAIRDSVSAGVDTIEHAIWRDPAGGLDFREDVLADVVRRDTALVWTLGGLARHELGLPGYERLAVDPSVASGGSGVERYRGMLAVEAVLASGATLGIGSDAGVRGTPFGGFADVLSAVSRLTGLPPGRIATMGSRDNAAVLGIEHHGLVPGAPADVVALDIAPAGPGHTFRVTGVWARGRDVHATDEVTL